MFADNQYAFDDKGRKYSANSTASLADDSSQVLWRRSTSATRSRALYFDMPKGAKLA
jgi:hypothetical protein